MRMPKKPVQCASDHSHHQGWIRKLWVWKILKMDLDQQPAGSSVGLMIRKATKKIYDCMSLESPRFFSMSVYRWLPLYTCEIPLIMQDFLVNIKLLQNSAHWNQHSAVPTRRFQYKHWTTFTNAQRICCLASKDWPIAIIPGWLHTAI